MGPVFAVAVGAGVLSESGSRNSSTEHIKQGFI